MHYGFWNKRWVTSQTGFHLDDVNQSLIQYFPKLKPGAHVLVPLCGKTKDLLWLAEQGYVVTGVEFVEQAALDFFADNNLKKTRQETSTGAVYRATAWPLEIVVGDIFDFLQVDFDALYDRAALIALPEEKRAAYTAHCQARLNADARVLLVTLEYPQELMTGPPFSVTSAEVDRLWAGRMDKLASTDQRTEDGQYKNIAFDFFNEVSYLG